MTGDMLKLVLEGLYISLQIGRLLLIWEYQFPSQVAEMCFANDLEFLCMHTHTHMHAHTSYFSHVLPLGLASRDCITALLS